MKETISLLDFGLDEGLLEQPAAFSELFVARVTEQHRDSYKVVCAAGELAAAVSGKFVFTANDSLGYPVVGDFVMIDRLDDAGGNAVIHHVLSRKSILTRKAAGSSQTEQAIVANVDTLFICMALDGDFNLRRLERYLAIAWESQAMPVIILTKSDLCDDVETKLHEVAAVALGVDVLVCSSELAWGLEAMDVYLEPGKTVAFIGSSGVGKSTLINRLMGEEALRTTAVRGFDGKGRHTTTSRQLVRLPAGGVVIDTPGMRELGLFAGDLTRTFSDIDDLAQQCRFVDCTHTNEPGCAVREALLSSELSAARLESFQKLELELSYSGLTSRELENAKINRMFGSKGEMKQALKAHKQKNLNRNDYKQGK